MRHLRSISDTIAAIATPVGTGGIAVLRISGSNAFAIADKSFRGSRRVVTLPSHTLAVGRFVDSSEATIDTVVISVFRQPHSYTGQDVAEVSCHGGGFVVQKILEAVIASGARLATPGEFTERAYLNGKMDLTQAEAVADLIRAKSDSAHRAALTQLQGRLGEKVNTLRTALLNVCALLELELDFAEEGIELADRTELVNHVRCVREDVQTMIDSYRYGALVREGVRVVLTGKPNAGKSSLLNVLLEENRAIVSEIAGTTRDVIEESVVVGGVLFRLIDTAGLREARDVIEHEGVRRAREQIESADIAVIVIDASEATDEDDWKRFEEIREVTGRGGGRTMFVVNKIDAEMEENASKVDVRYARGARISCRTHEGIGRLRELLLQEAMKGWSLEGAGGDGIGLRHKRALEMADLDLRRAEAALGEGRSNEFIAVDLRDAMDHLDEIIGRLTPEDVLESIFSQFCIGK